MSSYITPYSPEVGIPVTKEIVTSNAFYKESNLAYHLIVFIDSSKALSHLNTNNNARWGRLPTVVANNLPKRIIWGYTSEQARDDDFNRLMRITEEEKDNDS